MTFEWPSWVHPLPFPFPELHKILFDIWCFSPIRYYGNMTALSVIKTLILWVCSWQSFRVPLIEVWIGLDWDKGCNFKLITSQCRAVPRTVPGTGRGWRTHFDIQFSLILVCDTIQTTTKTEPGETSAKTGDTHIIVPLVCWKHEIWSQAKLFYYE